MSGSVTGWHPRRVDTLESHSAEIWDDLPNQQDTLPPPCWLTLLIIRQASLQAR